jgi:hypothetical protein
LYLEFQPFGVSFTIELDRRDETVENFVAFVFAVVFCVVAKRPPTLEILKEIYMYNKIMDLL